MVLAALALMGAACGHGGPPPTGSAGARPSTPKRAPGCGNTAPVGSSTIEVTSAGRVRPVIVHVPSRYRAGTPTPLVLNMHGSGGSAAQQEVFTGMDATADRDRFVVAYPQGQIPSGAGFEWHVPGVPLFGGGPPPPNAPDDVAFLTGLVRELSDRYCIDQDKVFATGFSGGARMASQLACDASGVFAAVAPVSGLRLPSPCPASPVPVVSFHGTADPVDPYNGNGQAYWTYSVPTAARRWAARDRCGPTPRTTSSSGYSLEAFNGCAAGVTVELYTLTSEGHEWPGGPKLPSSVTRRLGPQSDALNANTTMWAFFTAHPMR